jgi:hypothetical protein
MPDEKPHRIPSILCQRIEKRPATLIAVSFFGLIDAAELTPGRRARVVPGRPAANVVFSEQLEMGLDFIIQVAIAASSREDAEKPQRDHAQSMHVVLPYVPFALFALPARPAH